MGLFQKLFNKKDIELPSYDLSDIGVDIHSHLIPGIDDGSKSLDDSIAMLTKMYHLGFKKVITTPHIMSDYYRNTPEIILSGLNDVRAELQRLNIDIEIEAAAEYYYDETLLEKLRSEEGVMTFGDNYLLFEFAFHDAPPQVETLFFEMLSKGYKPVLAHLERYAHMFNKLDTIKVWKEKGINIQLNLNSLSGHYGPEVKAQAELLIDEKCVDFVGTDCHRIEHLMLLEKTIKKPYMHKLGELNLKNRNL